MGTLCLLPKASWGWEGRCRYPRDTGSSGPGGSSLLQFSPPSLQGLAANPGSGPFSRVHLTLDPMPRVSLTLEVLGGRRVMTLGVSLAASPPEEEGWGSVDIRTLGFKCPSCLETPTAAWPRKVSGEEPSCLPGCRQGSLPLSQSPGPSLSLPVTHLVGKCFSLSLVPAIIAPQTPDVAVWGCRQCLC